MDLVLNDFSGLEKRTERWFSWGHACNNYALIEVPYIALTIDPIFPF